MYVPIKWTFLQVIFIIITYRAVGVNTYTFLDMFAVHCTSKIASGL